MTAPTLRRRAAGDAKALPDSLHPVLRRLYAARGVQSHELALDLKSLLPPQQLMGIDAASGLLEAAVRNGDKIVIAGDYDADGATGVALGMLALRALGAREPGYVVPDRFKMGYGLTPPLAELAAEQKAQLLLTVDNGIASVAGVARAKELGMRVVITDHHLAGAQLPAADAIVNPNQPGCAFASKNLAGVGVMFYVLSALRSRLRDGGWFAQRAEPNLAEFLDLAALGTVADLVRLDHNNRVLVQNGLKRIRAGRARPGIAALLQVAGHDGARTSSRDLGFTLGPRINAAGRLTDIRTGIECLLAADEEQALPLARALDGLNRERRGIEAQMRDEALEMVEGCTDTGVCVYDQSWHEGVVGLVASRVKDKLHRPAIAFARAQESGMLKGSARSIDGLHVRDALALIDARKPGLMVRYGGHAMAAGLTLNEHRLEEFRTLFDGVCRELLGADSLQQILDSDGALAETELCLDTARLLEQAGPWGQGFAAPLFENEFEIVEARAVGQEKNHVRYRLRSGAASFAGIHFHASVQTCKRARAAYRLNVNRWNGTESADLLIELIEPV